MMNAIIVDDEPAGRRTLRQYCDAERDLCVLGEFGEGASALQAIRANQPHLVFLDIQMDGLSGLEVARALPVESMPSIVFVTAYDNHAVEAFELNAVDYLLKPFDQERFRKTLARVRPRHLATPSDERHAAMSAMLAQLERSLKPRPEERPRLLAEAGGHMHLIDAARVELIEADRNYVSIRVGRENFVARSTLQQAEEALTAQPLLRISRSCLVNMNFVREVSRTLRGDFILVMAGGATVTSSEGFRSKVKDYLGTLRIDSFKAS
jgi:two-component system LytT family response regulator